MTIRKTMTAVGLSLGLAAAPVAVMAQDSEEPNEEQGIQTMDSETQPMQSEPETMQGDTETASYDDAEVDAFADAVIQITEIRNSYAGELQGASDQEEQQQIMQKANAEMQAAIEEVDGMTVDRYLAMAEQAAQDEDLTQRIGARIETKMQ
ncbi:DUF4168 domain-containing protein [Allosediminivita pacifica]|uniref:Uncharacterized protein DUF4168 n=1 Tax=Allosediminivita pacifica TaxID=1267769 RepID=A0A2T6B7T4_9RHOB|nr:DUF4168 domain-containing protein [Allosediminivita pacifica]PTX52140.1 uncharacterized protein DUF4168 [Allosediminivita pacifica]GGA96817.1 hypothetical protein GCM10011324_03870 [Allosediminivita pacifica]